MTVPIIQIMIGVGLGIIAYLLLRPKPIAYTECRRDKQEYTAQPGDTCTICLNLMISSSMKYLNCGHALHKDCYKDLCEKNGSKCPICRK